MTAERVIPNFEEPPAPVEFDAPRNGNGTTPLRPRTNSTTTRRVPPHDEATEAALLGAMLTSPDACTAATHLAPTDFFNVAHQHVFTAATGLHAKGEPVEVRTVADALRRDGLFDHVREDRLVGLIAGEYVASSAPTYARIVADHARLRALIAVAAEIADLGYSLPDDVAQVETRAAELVAACAARHTPTDMEPLVADMQAVLDGEADVILPNLAPRDDHATCLLYAPGINWLDGEPGKGKTMLAMWWAYRELIAGNRVVYIQFGGEGNKHNVGARLKQMGLTDATRFSYIMQSGSWTPTELMELRALFALHPTLVVIDSVAGAMQAEGLDPESNRDVEQWKACIPAWAVKEGAAVLPVDHLTKNAESRGRFSIGAQRKLGIADVSYRLLMHEEAGLGRTGHGKLEVMKDREGALGAYQQGKVIANVSIASEKRGDTYELRVALTAPEVSSLAADGPTWYMQRVSEELDAHGPLGKVELRTRVGKRKDLVDLAIERLLDEGAIRVVETKGRSRPFESVYRWFAPSAPPPAPSFYETDDEDI